MNDEPDANETLDEGQDAQIRALLAELGSGPDGERMPPEIAARLDDTLARLVAERATTAEVTDDETSSGNVVPLRRRWGSRATAAVAAVIVLGAGGVAAANLGILGNTNSTVSSDSSAGGASEGQPESAPDTADSSSSAGGDVAARKRSLGTVGLPALSAGSFASDVTRLLQRRTALVAPDEAASPGSGADEDTSGNTPSPEAPQLAKQDGALSALKARDCPGPQITDGGVPNAVAYDGQLAVLVVHPETDGRQLVEVWTCAGDSRLDNATITR